MTLLALVTLTVAASEVSLSVDAGTPCLERESLGRALTARGLKLRASAEALEVQIAPAPGGLEVSARRKERRLQRRVPAEASACPAVERVVVALIESWAHAPAASGDSERTTRPDAGAAGPERSGEPSEPARPPASTKPASPATALPATPTPPSTATKTAAAGPASAAAAPPPAASVASASATPTPPASPAGTRGTSPTAPAPGSPASTTTATTRPASAPSTSPAPGASASPSTATTAAPAASAPSTSPAPAASGPSATPAPGASGSPSATTTPAPAGAAGMTSPEPNTSASPSATTAPAPTMTPGTTSPEPAASASSSATTPPAPPARDAFPFSFSIGGIAGGTLDGSGSGAGAGSLLVRVALGRWGLLADLGIESARTATREGVTATAVQQWTSLSFNVTFAPSELVLLDVALGLRGWRTEASATGVDVRTDRIALTWGPQLSGGVAVRVSERLSLLARASGSWRTVELRLSVDPLGPVLTLNPWNFGLQGGVLVTFD